MRNAMCSMAWSGYALLEKLEGRRYLSLLGVVPFDPRMTFASSGTLAYDAAQGTMDVSASPLIVRLPGATKTVKPIRGLELHVKLDSTGKLLGGAAGDDLSVTGWVDMNNNNVLDAGDYSGTLLTGEVRQFGYQEAGQADQYDFRFVPTGGALAPFFAGKDIGLLLTSENSTFDGSDGGTGFTTSFTGQAKGTLGAIDTLAPGSIAGQVYEDFNDDGQRDFGEDGIAGTTVTLTGVDYRGTSVTTTTQTNADGAYAFTDLLPGTYAVAETQPAGYVDGKDTLGSLGGVVSNDLFSSVPVAPNDAGVRYDFGERLLSDGPVSGGMTATIGFWHNKNGQALINKLNGGPSSTQLGNWLAATLPNTFGAQAGSNNLAGKTNSQVAQFYLTQFSARGMKLDAQVLAVALAVYATDSSLAGNVAASYGFSVTTSGTGQATFKVGSSGAAFGVANGTTMTVMDLLLAADARSVAGTLYVGNTALRTAANSVFDGINTTGDI